MRVEAVCLSPDHRFSKVPQPLVELIPDHGLAGDTHAGTTVQHRSRVVRDPSQPNLRQVHLLHVELLDELVAAGFEVTAGSLGENVTTRGVDLLDLPRGSRLLLGDAAVLEVTGLRNPCPQLDGFQPGLTAAVLDRGAGVELIRRAGVMAIVKIGGMVRPGDPIRVEPPDGNRLPLEPV